VLRLALALLVVSASVAAMPSGKPEEVGLSSERLQRITKVIQQYMDSKQIAGAITVVARRGRIAHFATTGLMDIEQRTPMRRDAIFRMASMTKPVTGVAILMLVEDGKVRLDDPVSRFIPEFKDAKVAVERPARVQTGAGGGRGQAPPPDVYTVPADREVTVRDLMTHTAGVVTNGPGARMAAKLAPRNANETLATHIPRVAKVPLDFQPGTAWRYSGLEGIDTLGRIVEIASGLTFDQFLKQRIFDPLEMRDTSFYPSEAKMPRVATLYGRTPEGLKPEETPSFLSRTLFSGGAGLWSTADDYLRFAQMLVAGGELNGRRLLSPRTIDLMSANHVGDLYGEVPPLGRRGMGFGLTVEVVMDPIQAGRRQSAGSFGWDGAFGTHFWVDRKEQLTGLLMIQQRLNAQLNRDFENAVMQAIVD
jgi:CubicO group peptidase (beta-lactamase class C family)